MGYCSTHLSLNSKYHQVSNLHEWVTVQPIYHWIRNITRYQTYMNGLLFNPFIIGFEISPGIKPTWMGYCSTHLSLDSKYHQVSNLHERVTVQPIYHWIRNITRCQTYMNGLLFNPFIIGFEIFF